MRKNVTQRLVLCALLVAITSLLKCTTSIMLPFAGAGGMRISLSTFFSKLPAFLFGASAGVMTSVLQDIIPAFLKPDGAYLPLLTVTAGLGGFLCGFLYKKFDGLNVLKFKKIFFVLVIVLGIVGIINCIFALFFSGSAYNVIIKSMGEKRSWFVTWGFLVFFAVGILSLALDKLVMRNNSEFEKRFIKILLVLLVSNLIVTTLNTFILRMFIPSLSSLEFLVFFIPRLVEEIIATVIQAYVGAYLLHILNKSGIAKKWV